MDIARLEERLLEEELARWAEVRRVDVRRVPLPLRGPREVEAALVRPVSMYRAAYSAASYEAAGVFTVNSSRTIITAGDKVLAYAALASAKLPVPASYYADSVEAAVEAGEALGYPVVVKPAVGSWGRMVARARSREKLEQVARLRSLHPCGPVRASIVQEYVETGVRDIRCIVVDGRLLGCITRRAREGEWRSNVALGANVESYPADPQLEDLAVRAADAVGGFFVSIDLFETRDGYLVNEVNGVPEFKGFMRATGLNPAREVSLAMRRQVKA